MSLPAATPVGAIVGVLCVVAALALGRGFGLLFILFVLFFALPMWLTHLYFLLKSASPRPWVRLLPSSLSLIGVLVGAVVLL